LDNALITALAIAAIGMTLLFLALILFYGMISLLTATVRDKPSTPVPPTKEEEGEGKAEEVVLRAAAIAIALARAEAEEGSSRPTASIPVQSAIGRVSPWWALYHQRQVSTYQTTRRSP
jgi:Na+-transporting methylmalonyl-CoA/oxaloacetate decarboxylase gamma subunit